MSEEQRHFEGYVEPVRLGDSAARRSLYLKQLPSFTFERNPDWPVPNREECFALWDKYAMPQNIRAHSLVVAEFAVCLAQCLADHGADIHVPSVLASGLLHDLGKFYTIKHGGSHGQIGGAWVINETRNPHIAQGVIQHVRWPWNIDETIDAWLLSYCIIYSDKRVMHDRVVTLEERYVDLLERYGVTEDAKVRIAISHQQGLEIGAALSRRARRNFNEYTFDSGLLVHRT